MKIDLMNSGLSAEALDAAGLGGAELAKLDFEAEHDAFVLDHGGVKLDVQQMADAKADFSDFKNGIFKRFCLLGAGDLEALVSWTCGALFCKGERHLLISVSEDDDFARFDPALAARVLQKHHVIPVIAASRAREFGRGNARGEDAKLPFGSPAMKKAAKEQGRRRLNRTLREFLKELPCAVLLWGCGPALIEAPLFACATACITDLELDFSYELNTTLSEWKKSIEGRKLTENPKNYPEGMKNCLMFQRDLGRYSPRATTDFLLSGDGEKDFYFNFFYCPMDISTEIALMALERPAHAYIKRLAGLSGRLGRCARFSLFRKSDLFTQRIIPVFTHKGRGGYPALLEIARLAGYDFCDFVKLDFGTGSVIKEPGPRRAMFITQADGLVREMLAGEIGKSSKVVIKLSRKWPETIFFAECTELSESEKELVRLKLPEPICQGLLDNQDLEAFFRKHAGAEKYQSYEYEPAPPYKHRAFFAPVKFSDLWHDFSVSLNFSDDFYRAIKDVRITVADLVSAVKTLSQLQEAGGRRPSSKNFWQNKEDEFRELLLKFSAGHKEAA